MISVKELAKKLNKHPNTIYNWIRRGMPCIRTDKDFFLEYEEVINWLKEESKKK